MFNVLVKMVQYNSKIGRCGGLVSGSSALAGDIALCSWARHFTLTLPLSTQVYKWVLVNLMLGMTCNGLASHPWGWGRVET